MKQHTLRPVLIAGFLGLCATSNADVNKSGPYVSAIGGVNFLSDTAIEATVGSDVGRGDASFNASYLVGAAFGYRFNNNWAVEEEVVFRRVVLDGVNLSPLGQFDDGNFENTQFSVKALYHFPLRANSDFEGYAGVGLVWLSELDFDVESAAGEQPFENDEFGLELHLGGRYHGWDRAFVGAGVRYLIADDVQLKAPSDNRNVVRADYDPLAIALEFGWRF